MARTGPNTPFLQTRLRRAAERQDVKWKRGETILAKALSLLASSSGSLLAAFEVKPESVRVLPTVPESEDNGAFWTKSVDQAVVSYNNASEVPPHGPRLEPGPAFWEVTDAVGCISDCLHVSSRCRWISNGQVLEEFDQVSSRRASPTNFHVGIPSLRSVLGRKSVLSDYCSAPSFSKSAVISS